MVSGSQTNLVSVSLSDGPHPLKEIAFSTGAYRKELREAILLGS